MMDDGWKMMDDGWEAMDDERKVMDDGRQASRQPDVDCWIGMRIV
jgi:hypothetical protein